MSVFDASTKTGREVKDPLSDKTLPPPASLSWKTITTPAALAGTVGIDCKLVHGNRFQQIDQSMTENYGGNVTTTIGSNQTRTIGGDQKMVVAGNRTAVIGTNLLHVTAGSTTRVQIGAVTQLDVSATNEVYVGVLTENHASPKQENEPLHVESDAICIATKGVDLNATGVQAQTVGVSVGAFGVKAEVGGVAVSGIGAELASRVLGIDVKGFFSANDPIDLHLFGGKVQLGGIKPEANGVQANAGPNVGPNDCL